MLVQFDEDVKVLSQIPLTKGIVDQMRDTKMMDSIRYWQVAKLACLLLLYFTVNTTEILHRTTCSSDN